MSSTAPSPRPDLRSAAQRRVAYLVLGMHRSGTSALSQLLSIAGAELPRNVMPGDDNNAQGYFEPWRIANFNDERLRAAGSAWDDVFAYPSLETPAPDADDWRERAAALFEEEYVGRRTLLVKDPRVTVLMPLWREVLEGLDIAARCVIPVRHPLAVAGSLGRRDGFPPEKSVLLWTTHMLAAEAYSRALPRAFVDYDRTLADWRGEVARIERAHGAALPRLDAHAAEQIDAALKSDLRHNRAQGDLAALGWTGRLAQTVYDALSAAARDEPLVAGDLDLVAQEVDERRRQFGPLVSPAACALDQVRGENLGLRQSLEWERREHNQLRARFEALQQDWLVQKEVIDEVGCLLDDVLIRGGPGG